MRTTTAILAAVAMTLMAFAPVAYAGNPNNLPVVDDDGALSRTFLYQGSIEWKPHSTNPEDGIGGLGWYHPDDRDGLCLFRLFGLNFGAGFYYEGFPKPRVIHNAPNLHVAHVEENGIEGDLADTLCPNSTATTPGQFLGTSAFNLWVSRKRSAV